MRRKLLSAVFLAGLMLATPAASSFDSEPFIGRGVVRAVRWIEGDVMLQTDEGFLLVLLEDDATVSDAHGVSMALRDLPLGAEIEYEARYWEGQAFASSLRVRAGAVVVGAR